MTFVLEKQLRLRLVHNSYDFEFALFDQKDYDEVWNYALPFANAGDSNAQCMMSLLLQHGFGVSANLDEPSVGFGLLPSKTILSRGTISERCYCRKAKKKKRGDAIKGLSNSASPWRSPSQADRAAVND